MTDRVKHADIGAALLMLGRVTGDSYAVEKGSRVNGRRWKVTSFKGHTVASAPDARGLVHAISAYHDGYSACMRYLGIDAIGDAE